MKKRIHHTERNVKGMTESERKETIILLYRRTELLQAVIETGMDGIIRRDIEGTGGFNGALIELMELSLKLLKDHIGT